MAGHLEAKKTRLFLDMDGVFCDFERGVQELQARNGEPVKSSVDFNHEEKTTKQDLIWPMIFKKDPMFFANLKPMAGAMELWASIQSYLERADQIVPIFLTGCPKGERFRCLAEEGKSRWIARYFIEDGNLDKVHRMSVKESATEENRNQYLAELETLLGKVHPGEAIAIFCRPNQKQFFSLPLSDGRKPILLDDRGRAGPLWEKLEQGTFLHHESEPAPEHFLQKNIRNELSKAAVRKTSRALNSMKGGRRQVKKTRRNRSLHVRKTRSSK